MNVDVWTDASYRAGVQRAGIGVTIREHRGETVLYEASEPIPFGPGVNCAEYDAFIHAATWCVNNGVKRAWFKTDSRVMYEQLKGAMQTKSPELVERRSIALSILSNLERWNIQHIPREKNGDADKLAGAASGRDVPKGPRLSATLESVDAQIADISSRISADTATLNRLLNERAALARMELHEKESA